MGKVDVVIIPVDLGEDVKTIVSDEIRSLTEDNRDRLDALKRMTENMTLVRETKERTKRITVDAIQASLDRAMEALIKAGDEGIHVDVLMSLVKPLITTSSAFMMRLKTQLKQNGNEYAVMRVKEKYLLIPYNQTPDDPI